jgi:hypothetical protein
VTSLNNQADFHSTFLPNQILPVSCQFPALFSSLFEVFFHVRKSAAWISRPGDFLDEEEEEEDAEDGETFQRFGSSLYNDEVPVSCSDKTTTFVNRLCFWRMLTQKASFSFRRTLLS